MNSSRSSATPKRNAILQNKLNVRSPNATSKAPVAANSASRGQSAISGRGRGLTTSASQHAPGTSQSAYGSGSIHSAQAMRPPAGVPSHLARRPSAAPSSSSYNAPFRSAMSKSPRYRKPPVTSHLMPRPNFHQKPTRPAVSCDNLDQQNRSQNNYEEEEVPEFSAEPEPEAGGDSVEEKQNDVETENIVKEPAGPSFPERFMKQMQDKLLTDRPNEFRASTAVGDVKMEIARIVGSADVEQNDDPNRPQGHVTLLPEICQSTIQALKSRFDFLTREYNSLPVESDTIRMRNRRNLLERELTHIEEGLLIFARNKVHVKDLDSFNRT